VIKTTSEEAQTRFFSSLQHQTAVANKGQWAKPEKSYCCKYIAILLFYLIAHIKSSNCSDLHLSILIKYSYIHLHSLILLLSYCCSLHRESCYGLDQADKPGYSISILGDFQNLIEQGPELPNPTWKSALLWAGNWTRDLQRTLPT